MVNAGDNSMWIIVICGYFIYYWSRIGILELGMTRDEATRKYLRLNKRWFKTKKVQDEMDRLMLAIVKRDLEEIDDVLRIDNGQT